MLSAAVSFLRARGTIGMDWIPLVWAGCIFLWQLQYGWAVIELSGLIHTWTILEFAILLILYLRARERRGRGFITVLYAALSLGAAWIASPKAY